MRLSPLAVGILLILPALGAFAPAGATSGAAVFAGESVRTTVNTPFFLVGHAEGFDSGTTTVSWTTSGPCVLADASALSTLAECSAPGVQAFTLTVTDATSSASDDVRIVVVRDETRTLAEASGHVEFGAPDEAWNYRTGTGLVDESTTSVPMQVPAGTASLRVRLDWTETRNDFDLDLDKPGGSWYSSTAGRNHGLANTATVVVSSPEAGEWMGVVKPFLVVDDSWTLTATAVIREGDVPLPSITAGSQTAEAGDLVTLEATPVGGTAPYAVAWESSPTSYAFDDGAGTTFAFTYAAATAIKVKVTDANGLEAVSTTFVRDAKPTASADPRPMTVIAVVDNAFSPYHMDFVGHQHPWNRDADSSNDFDFTADPITYIPGYPGAEALDISIPQTPDEDITALESADSDVWSSFKSGTVANPKLYWIPGTKIIGATSFGGTWKSTLSQHGTRSAASAAGNWHGSCQECVFVLIQGGSSTGLRWAAQQPWIDVITNSYGASIVGGLVRDNIYFGAPVDVTQAASERGQSIVFSAGNGLLNAFVVPMVTYWSSEKGPDWIVTVGAVGPGSKQTYSGHGKPVDISSIGSGYPSTGGTTANGTGSHSGTSNAAPVTAGYFGKVIQEAREALGDTTPGNAGSIVASGTPVACGSAYPDCALGDGILTRDELEDLVYHNVLPSDQRIVAGTYWPTTDKAYYYQGHGFLAGLIDGQEQYDAEWRRMVAVAVGDEAPYTRPAGEAEWMTVDSKCRQKLWGAWDGGYYHGVDPVLDNEQDTIATAFNTWCDEVQQDFFRNL